jgi:hypothetical protein
VKRFITFYDFIDRFGLGMVILPSIVDNLGGTLTAKPCRVGSDGGSSSNLKLINFTDFKICMSIPLLQTQADPKKVMSSPYKAINKTKETQG